MTDDFYRPPDFFFVGAEDEGKSLSELLNPFLLFPVRRRATNDCSSGESAAGAGADFHMSGLGK